uniref:Putative gag-polypeptide of LTR copia-type n=1 Tax=Helianthus annuus TaxID=4232 RepID=A0A251SY86_HELAN
MAGEDGTSKPNESIDPASPLYLHPSDYPRQMQVNDNLTDSNFNDWVQEMTNFLFAKNKIGFVDGSIVKPETTSKDYMPWMRCDAMVKGWLTTAMDKEIRGSVKYANTASEIWADLKERFGKESAPRAYELKQSLHVTRHEGTTVSAYFTRLIKIWDEINMVLPAPRCTCSGCKCEVGKKITELKEKERLYEFLMGLDDEFSVVSFEHRYWLLNRPRHSAMHIIWWPRMNIREVLPGRSKLMMQWLFRRFKRIKRMRSNGRKKVRKRTKRQPP